MNRAAILLGITAVETEGSASLSIRRASRISSELHPSVMGLIQRALPNQVDRDIIPLVRAPDLTRGAHLHR